MHNITGLSPSIYTQHFLSALLLCNVSVCSNILWISPSQTPLAHRDWYFIVCLRLKAMLSVQNAVKCWRLSWNCEWSWKGRTFATMCIWLHNKATHENLHTHELCWGGGGVYTIKGV